jgi:hypothetical protein
MIGRWSHDEPPDALDDTRTGRYGEVFYSGNPVRPGSPSWSEPNVDSWRFGVLESDEAPADLWLRAVVLMRLPIVAIYTSGGRSIHVLYRMDGATTKEELDARIAPRKREFIPIGACPKAMTAVRLTRLPGCWRGKTKQWQRLLYLDPNPDGGPIYKEKAANDQLAA